MQSTINMCVTSYSHFFKVTRLTPRGRAVVDSFARQFVQYGLQKSYPGGSFRRVASCVYAARTQNLSEYRFHINALPQFQKHIENNYLTQQHVEWKIEPLFVADKIKFEVQDGWEDKEYQTPIVQYLASYGAPVQKFLSLQTGKGKGYCTMKAYTFLSTRVVIGVKPMYLVKWVTELRQILKLEIDDIIVVRGSDQLIALLNMFMAGECQAKIILFSNKTLQNWWKLYEEHGEETLMMGYPIVPDQLFPLLRAGDRTIDELHQDFHLNFKFDLYTHTHHGISLSASLVAEDHFIRSMYELAYPLTQRFKELDYHRYVDSHAILYQIRNMSGIKSKGGQGYYSHIVFEESIMKQPQLLLNYLKMIEMLVNNFYLKKREAGEKCMVFCATIDMCTIVTAFLKKRLPELDVRRFVGPDPEENLHEPDIRVSTMISAGTARDIKNLIACIMSVCMSSLKGNIQGLGRLRELASKKTPQFAYLACRDIPKQMEYHESKKELLRNLALTYKEHDLGCVI